jgi:ABC-2 type transport system permease protein
VGLGFWSAIFGIAFRVLRYFRGVADIGNLVAAKILGILLLAFLAILLLSNLITALSTFFLAKDLDLMVGAPVDWFRFYLSKLGETLVHSSWMVILVAIPIFTAYGFVFDGGLLFPFVAMAAIVPYLVVPAVLGSALTLLLVNLFPARRTRDLLSLISEWAAQMVMNWLLRLADPLPILLLWTTAGAAVVFGALVHRTYYLPGFSKAQEGADRFVRGRAWQGLADRILGTLPASKREFILKDLRLFFRDSTQWSQLILLAVLLVVYLFNIQALQLFSGERVPFFLVTLVVFLNQGLAGFVLAAIAARFIFPSISLEGRQMWLLRSSPLDLRALLWSKYWIGTIPLLVLALILTVTTNALLQASGFMMVLSIGTITLFTLAVSALALGFGALYPQFETENAAQIPTSFGGLVFMMTTISLLGLVIVVEAIPVTGYLRARQAGMAPGLTPELVLTMVVVVTVCAIATLVPLKIGLKRMSEMEF